MAFNIFNATMDVLDNNQRTYDASYNRTDKAFKDVAARKAGMALAAGDRQGAMQAMGGEGELDAVRQMQLDQGREDQQAYLNKRQGEQDDIAEQKRKAEIMIEAVQDLSKVPESERSAKLDHPLWQALGMTPEMKAQIRADPNSLTDAGIAAFIEPVKKFVQTYQNDSGIYGVTSGGKVETLQEFEPKPTIVPQGSVAIGRDGRQMFTNPKTFAPPRARSGGGAGGLPPPPAGWSPAGR